MSASGRPWARRAVALWRFARVARLAGLASLVTLIGGVAWLAGYRVDEALFSKDQGGPLVVVARRGEVLRRLPAAEGGRPGREQWVPLSAVPSYAVLTLLASEDQRFYEHAGVDPSALLRALWLNATTSGRYGGSTLTMQLARMVHSAGEARSLGRKLVEVRAALGIERALSKDDILEQYLNRAYYGHGAYGLGAAAHRYFGKPAASLSVGETTLLAVLPRSPERYDLTEHLDRALARRHHLFELLVGQGRLGADEAVRAEEQPVTPRLFPTEFAAPHFVDWLVSELPKAVRDAGGPVLTTLDLTLQERVEGATREYVASRARDGLGDAAVVVLDAPSGEVLAMVGAADYAAPGGQMNMATWKRYPGSALKPFVYGAALEAGAAPSTIAYDVRDASDAYRMANARELGPVSYRVALGSSLNFAAVHTLERVGLASVMSHLVAAGVSRLELAPGHYGSRLALGSTRVRLVDLANAYRAFVRDGSVTPPSAVRELPGAANGATARAKTGTERRVFSTTTAYLLMEMLSAPEARRATFGQDLPVDLPYPVVAKTGTAEGLSDAVAVLATRELIVGVWAGRLDGATIPNASAMQLAAPLARRALLLASSGRPLSLPPEPPGLVTAAVCPLSGLAPGPYCPAARRERFRAGTEPHERCGWHGPEGHIAYPPELAGWQERSGRGRSAESAAASRHASR